MIYYWRSMIFLLKEAGDKTFMKYIDPTKSWGLPKAKQECKEKLDNMKIRMLSIQCSLSICKERIKNKIHLGQIQQMIVYLKKLMDGSTVQPTTEHYKTRKAKPVSLCLLNSYLGLIWAPQKYVVHTWPLLSSGPQGYFLAVSFKAVYELSGELICFQINYLSFHSRFNFNFEKI